MAHLLHLKCLCGWSDESQKMILELLKKAFNFGDTFPKKAYGTKKHTLELGLSYINIDACRNGYILH